MGMWCGSRCLGWKFENSAEGHCGYDWCDSANRLFAGSDRVTGTRGGVSPSMVDLESEEQVCSQREVSWLKLVEQSCRGLFTRVLDCKGSDGSRTNDSG